MGDVIAAFSLDQVSRLTGLSDSQLISWDQDDFFRPSLAYENRRSPYSRIYSFEDLVGLKTLSLLRDRVSMQHLKKAAERLKEHAGRPWSELTLYTLKREVHFKRPDTGQIEGAVSGQYGATIPLESVAEEMREQANKLRERDQSKIGRIERNKFIMGNAWVFGGTRIAVDTVRDLVAAGYSAKRIIEEFPDLRRADIEAAKNFTEDSTQAA
jgi:uncharacterized protein (DUF433 family)